MDLSAIGQQFGLNEEQTRAALEALVPVVAAGARRQAQSPEGLQDMLRTVLGGQFGQSMDTADAVSYDRASSSGNDVLGQIFGSKDVSREVAQQLSATSGIGAAILKKLLPIVATVVMGQMAKKMGAGTGSTGGGGLGDILGDILGGGAKPQSGGTGGGGLGDILGDILGGGQQSAPSGGSGGGLGDILKDVLGGGGRAQEEVPPEAPTRRPQSGGGSLEDILGEILNGGKGGVVVKQIPQDQMGDILKDIFGGGAAGAPQPEAVNRGRKTIDDILGGGTRTGSAADDLLNSVERSVRRR